MWHASARAEPPALALALARRALDGVGDAALGEWVEHGGGGTVHLRRRVSVDEQERVGDVRDIRGTTEERVRVRVLLNDAPHLLRFFPGLIA